MKISIKKSRYFYLFIVGGFLAIIGALLIAPFWPSSFFCSTWGIKVVSYIMAVAIICYLALYVFKRMIHSSGTILILYIVEFVIFALMALGLVFTQLSLLNIPDNPSFILGLILYCRGVIDIFRAYFHQKDSASKYPMIRLVVAIVLVTLGILLMCGKPINVDKVMLCWIIFIFMILFGLCLIVYGFLANPKKASK